MDNVKPVADGIKRENQTLMLVGHLPFMERITGYLVTGDPEQKVVSYRNAAVVCLVEGQDHWTVDWILTPELARR